MGCTHYDWIGPDGRPCTVIACSRGPRQRIPCSIPGCPNGSEALCDWPMAGQHKTCDRELCRQHRKPIGPNRDYCPEHFTAAMSGQ